MEISEKLLEKYNKPVPRYTSYPPANHFNEKIDGRKYIEMVKESNTGKPENIAFYIHIPYCQKICFYCGCNSCKLTSSDEHLKYHEALKKEIAMVSRHISKSRKVTQIHFGGGTPNSVSVNLISEIVDIIRSTFLMSADAEIAIECNPALLDREYVDQLKNAGFNRFSLGIQDFNEAVLKKVNRDPSKLPLDELMSHIRAGNSNIAVNLDFIYGLPGQDSDSFAETIRKAASLKPDRLVTFSYAHVPWMKPNQKKLEKYGLPGPTEKIEMFLAGYNYLKNNGYKPVGFDHYVLPGDELYRSLRSNMLHRNFQGYCTRKTTGQVYAFGVSAISQLDQGYVQNVKAVRDYIIMLENDSLPAEKGILLTDREKAVREFITHLMCNKQISTDMVDNISGTNLVMEDVMTINQDELGEFEADGLIEIDNGQIKVTEKGSMFVRNIAASLDPAYKPGKNKYSKSV